METFGKISANLFSEIYLKIFWALFNGFDWKYKRCAFINGLTSSLSDLLRDSFWKVKYRSFEYFNNFGSEWFSRLARKLKKSLELWNFSNLFWSNFKVLSKIRKKRIQATNQSLDLKSHHIPLYTQIILASFSSAMSEVEENLYLHLIQKQSRLLPQGYR